MSNETKVGVYDRLWKLWAMICKMIMDGVRDPEKVADILQTIVDVVAVSNYLKRLFANEVIKFGDVEVYIYQLVKDANFLKMFGDIGEKRRCWKNKEEALSLAREHKDKLGPDANFFELEGGFVAGVYLDDDGQPYVRDVSPLSSGLTCSAVYQHRVFCPQQ